VGLLFLTLTAGACSDGPAGPTARGSADLSFTTALTRDASVRLDQIDGWRVRASRSGEGTVAEATGDVSPGEVTIVVQLSVTLQAACESLTLTVELMAGQDVWFRSESVNLVCSGTGNELGIQELDWVGPEIAFSPATLSFSLDEGGAPRSQTLALSNPGGSALPWTAETDQDWLSVTPVSGTLGSGQSTNLTVTVTDTGLPHGTQGGTITLRSPVALNSPAGVPVTLDYSQLPRISLSPNSYDLNAMEGACPSRPPVTVTNSGGQVLSWNVTSDVPLLMISPTSGSLGAGESQEVQLGCAPGAYHSAGTYQGEITFSASGATNSPQSIPMVINIQPGPRLGFEPGEITFQTASGVDPPTQTVSLSNTSVGTLTWEANADETPWLEVLSTSGSLQQGQEFELGLRVNVAGLEPGTYEGAAILVTNAYVFTIYEIPVTLTVEADPRIGLSQTVVDLQGTQGGSTTAGSVTVFNDGDGVLQWSAADNQPWLSVTPSSGILGSGSGETLSLVADPSSLNQGTYQATVTVSAPGADNTPQTVQVNFTVILPTAPVISDLSVQLITLNDPTCPLTEDGRGSRFQIGFDFMDQNGDITISSGHLQGTPFWMLIDYQGEFTESLTSGGRAQGTGFDGSAWFQTCLVFDWTSYLDLSVQFKDDLGLGSNILQRRLNRPTGANSPPQRGGGGGGDL